MSVFKKYIDIFDVTSMMCTVTAFGEVMSPLVLFLKIKALVEVSVGLPYEVLMHCGSLHRSSEWARLPDCVRSVSSGRVPEVQIRIRQVEECCHEGHAACVLHMF